MSITLRNYATISMLSFSLTLITACGPEQKINQAVQVDAPKKQNSDNTNVTGGNQTNSATTVEQKGNGTVTSNSGSGNQTNSTTSNTGTGSQTNVSGSGAISNPGTGTVNSNTGAGSQTNTSVTGDQTNTTINGAQTNTTTLTTNTQTNTQTNNQTTNNGTQTNNNITGGQTIINNGPSAAPVPVPATPGGLASSNVTTTGLTLNWGAVTNATSYKIYKDNVLLAENLGSTSYNLTGLSAATTYSLQVSAVNGTGESGKSTALSVLTLTPVPVPSAPTGLSSGSLSQTGFTLSWGAVSGAASYKVYKDGALLHNNVSGTSQTISGLMAGTAYNMQVTAVNESGESIKSTGLSVTPAVIFTGTIVYIKNNDIYMMKGSNASPVQLTSTSAEGGRAKGAPRLNSSGTRVVWTRDAVGGASAGYDIHSVDTGAPNQIKNYNLGGGQVSLSWPTFASDGSIKFIAFDPTGQRYSASSERMYQVDASGNNMSQYSLNGLGAPINIRFDNVIVYSDSHVRRADYNNTNANITYTQGQNVRLPWSNNQDLFTYDYNGDIYTITVAGINTRITNTPAAESNPAMSPNETKIVFVSNDAGGRKDLFMVNIDGSGMVNLTNTPNADETLPDWSN